jgi:hypothetical protein
MISAGITSPLLVLMASGVAEVTCVPVSTRTPSASSSAVAAGGKLVGQRRQDARAGLDQRHLQALFVEHLQPVKAQRRSGGIELGGQFDAGSAAADDGDARKGIGLRVSRHLARHAQALVEQAAAEAIGIGAAIERQVFSRTPGVPKSFDTEPTASTR